jgi:uncharacterized protein YjbJ (UPF0337 family)
MTVAGDEERTDGETTELEGQLEKEVGAATGDPDLEGEGVKDEAIGKVEQAIGEAKDAWQEVRDDG